MRKRIYLKFIFWVLVFVLLSVTLCGQQNVAINTTGAAPDSSAIVDIQSAEKGLLIPRMSSIQRTSIVRPAEGLLVFDTDHHGFWFYTDGLWLEIQAGMLGVLSDKDADTYIQVEQQPDEDAIRFYTQGQERMVLLDDGRAALGASVPGPGVILELKSDNKAFVPPRMFFQQIQQIPQPSPGMLVYDTEFRCLRTFNGDRWECLQGKAYAKYRPPGDSYGQSAGGAEGDDIGWQAAADQEGNIYITGYFEDTIRFFDQEELTAVGKTDVFLVKLDPQLQVLWAVAVGGAENDRGHGLSLDLMGNVLIAGSYRGSVAFGDTMVNGYDGNDIFVASYTGNGLLRWVQTAGGNGQDGAESVATDADGNVYITGQIWSTATFADTTVTSAGYRDVFLAKYDPDGNFKWVQRCGGARYEASNAVAVGANGQIYIAGNFEEVAGFSLQTLSSQDESDLFLASFEPDGTINWARSYGGDNDSYCKGMVIDEEGMIHLAGDFQTQLNFGSTELTAKGATDAYLAKFMPDGTAVWARSAGSSGAEEGWGPAFDAQGNVYFTGGFQETIDFGETQLESDGTINVFLAKYNAEGQLVWAEQAGGSQMTLGTKVLMSPQGMLYVLGAFQERARFGNTELKAKGGFDVFLWKYVE